MKIICCTNCGILSIRDFTNDTCPACHAKGKTADVEVTNRFGDGIVAIVDPREYRETIN